MGEVEKLEAALAASQHDNARLQGLIDEYLAD